MEQIKLMLGTVVLTLLIWTTADQLLSDTHEIEVTIVPVTSGEHPAIVQTDPPGQTRFKLTVTGPRRRVEQLRDQARTGQLRPLSIPVPDHISGTVNVDVRRALEGQSGQLLGLRVDKVDPPQVRVLVDRLTTVVMPVQVERGVMEFDVPPRADPAEVRVTLPESALANLAQVQLRLAVADLFLNQPAGESLTIPGVPLPQKLGEVDIQTDPPTVTIRATLREQIKIGTIPAVPIAVQASPENFNRFEVRTRDGRTLISRAITVQGPPAVVDSLVAGRTPVTGRVVLTGDLVAQGGQFIELQPVFDLPPDVHLAAPVQPVELSLIPRSSPPK